MPDVVIVSDTHVPARARVLPPPLWSALAAADVVLHAGDWLSGDLLESVRDRARLLVGCVGNNDDAAVRAVLPEVARAVVGGVRVAVLHDSGPRSGRETRLAARFGSDTDLIVFGHSHIPWDSVVPGASGAGGMRLLNPGSPTDRRRQPVGTWLTARFADGRIEDLVVHEVPPRA